MAISISISLVYLPYGPEPRVSVDPAPGSASVELFAAQLGTGATLQDFHRNATT